jgi:hypothetical protein
MDEVTQRWRKLHEEVRVRRLYQILLVLSSLREEEMDEACNMRVEIEKYKISVRYLRRRGCLVHLSVEKRIVLDKRDLYTEYEEVEWIYLVVEPSAELFFRIRKSRGIS